MSIRWSDGESIVDSPQITRSISSITIYFGLSTQVIKTFRPLERNHRSHTSTAAFRCCTFSGSWNKMKWNGREVYQAGTRVNVLNAISYSACSGHIYDRLGHRQIMAAVSCADIATLHYMHYPYKGHQEVSSEQQSSWGPGAKVLHDYGPLTANPWGHHVLHWLARWNISWNISDNTPTIGPAQLRQGSALICTGWDMNAFPKHCISKTRPHSRRRSCSPA